MPGAGRHTVDGPVPSMSFAQLHGAPLLVGVKNPRKLAERREWGGGGGVDSPVLKDMPGAGRHTVDGPVGAALVIADGDAEPAVVGAHDLNELPGPTAHLQLLALAGVARPDAGVVLSCNTKSR
jgi:hypothetical protein